MHVIEIEHSWIPATLMWTEGSEEYTGFDYSYLYWIAHKNSKNPNSYSTETETQYQFGGYIATPFLSP